MKKYITYFKLRFITEIQYRAAAIAGISTQFFFGLVFIMVYKAFYESGNEGPMTFNETATYLWIGQAFYALTYIFHREKDIIQMIKNGNVSYELCRPSNLYFMWFSKIYGAKLSSVLLRFLPIIIIGLLLPYPYNIMIPTLPNFIGFILTLILGSILICSIVTLFHVLVFYTIDSDGILNSFRVFCEFFAGSLVPIPFMPNIIQKISKFLPFQYMSDIPIRIFIGNVSINETLSVITIQIFWIIIMILISLLLTKNALKKVVIQGG